MNTRSADISSTGIMTPKQNCNADQNNNYIKSYVPKKTSHLPPKTHIWKSYYYLADGEFDLVYRNIAVYIVAHIMFLYGWYSLIRHDNWDMDFIKSYVWGELIFGSEKRCKSWYIQEYCWRTFRLWVYRPEVTDSGPTSHIRLDSPCPYSSCAFKH